MLRPLIRWTYRHLVHPSARNSLRLMLLLDERDRPPELIADYRAARVMVLAPHMDDEVIGCGGALVSHIREGAKVAAVYLTDGRWGDAALFRPGVGAARIAVMQLALTAARKEEARRAAAILGIQEMHFLDAEDGALAPDDAIVERLLALITQFEPDIVYVPFAMDVHEDHWQTNLILAACLDRLPEGVARDLLCRGYEVWSPLPANRLADVTNVMEVKREALRAFASQLKDNDYVRCAEALNAYRSIGALQGRGYAEAFHETSGVAYRQLLREVSR